MCDEEDRKEAHRLGREYEKMHRRIEDKQWLADAEAVDPSVNERGYVDPRELEKAAGTLQKCVKFLKDGEDASGAATMTSTILASMELLLAEWAPVKADGSGITDKNAKANQEQFRKRLDAYKANGTRFPAKKHVKLKAAEERHCIMHGVQYRSWGDSVQP